MANIDLWRPQICPKSSPSVVATTLGLKHPFKKPLRKQNAHFRFNTQLVGNKMASHFEFQHFWSKNKLLGAIFVHFSSPSVVATTLGARAPLEKAPKKAKCPFKFCRSIVCLSLCIKSFKLFHCREMVIDRWIDING